MLSKSRISYIRSLHLKKFRDQHQSFIAEGSKLITDLISSGFDIEMIYCSADKLSELAAKISKNTDIQPVSFSEMEKISNLTQPADALAVLKIPLQKDINPGDEWILMLDDIQDPGNMGTIIRTADWFGIHKIICSEQTVEIYNPKVIQATMGSIARVQVVYCDLAAFLSNNNKLPVYGTLLKGTSVYNADLKSAGIILLGNEGKGISEKLLKFIQYPITIPRYGKAESLNVAIASAVICAEFRRQDALKKII